MKAWHFLREDNTCGHGELGAIEVGKTYTVEPPIELCRNGLHASVRLIDALRYAPGPVLCRVEMGGAIIEGDDKVVATERKVLWMRDISTLLHHFACDEAEAALITRNVTDERSWNVIKVKRAWLTGDATDDELIAAGDAAWAAARTAAWDAQNDRLTAQVNELMQ